MIWERVHTFGSHTHIIKNGRTICGRDVSLYTTEVHKNPTKKCKRCLELAFIFEPEHKLSSTFLEVWQDNMLNNSKSS